MAPEPIAVALDSDHLAVMQQPVKNGGGDYRIAEQFLPVTKLLLEVMMVELLSYRYETNWKKR
jgi:hypothetical protein